MNDAKRPEGFAATERAYTVDALTESLRARLSAGEFEVGSWIRQARIAEEYGVSRTPVALALSRLEATGIVERVANRGFRVRPPSVRDIMEIHEVRQLLEGHAAYLAATRISDGQVKRLFQAVESFREVAQAARVGDRTPDDLRGQWHEANSAFHATVFEASGNRLLLESAEILHLRVPRNITWMAMRGDPRLLAQNAHEHEAIAIAIDVHDGARARELAVAHMNTARELILARFEGGRPVG